MTFRYAPIKYNRSLWPMVVFFIFFGIMFYIHITMVIPTLNGNVYTYVIIGIHVALWITVSVSFLLTSCRDPGYLRKEELENGDIQNLLKHFHPDDICPRCEVLTTPRS